MNSLWSTLPPRASVWRWTACPYGAENHVPIRQLVEDFARYLYLPRLQTTTVLLNAIRDGLSLLTWEHDAFAYAENYDESAGRYRGLRSGPRANITEDDTGLLVRPEVARRQIDQETTQRAQLARRPATQRYQNLGQRQRSLIQPGRSDRPNPSVIMAP